MGLTYCIKQTQLMNTHLRTYTIIYVIGKEMHEEPEIVHVGSAGTGLKLEAGMTFTIECLSSLLLSLIN